MALLNRSLGWRSLGWRSFGWRTFGRAQRSAETPVKLAPVLLVIGAIIVLVALVQLVQTSNATTSNFAIQELGQQKLEAETRVGRLESEIGGLSSLPRIEREATGRLGLVPPVDQRSVSVNVPLPAAEVGLPSRFAPDAEPEVAESDDSWWQNLLDLLPFN
ncbi:MAG: hypothetical protein WBD55_12885 [Dehalococcoidia bacterium]